MRNDTSAGDGLQRAADHGGISKMPLRGLSTLLLLGGIVYAILSGNWGIGALAFGFGVVVLGLDRLRMARSRADRAIGWVLVLCGGALTIMFIAVRMTLGVT